MNLEELKSKVNELNEERKKIVQAEGQKVIAGTFRELFDKHPKLESVTWTQYTPYFNDGEACEFSVHELRSAVYDGNEEEEPAYWSEEYKIPREVCGDLKALQRALQSLDDSMELIFGDHVQVTASRDGFAVDEYGHD